MDCNIISAKGTDGYGDIDSVTLPGLSGQLQILPGHAEIFLSLGQGQITVVQKNGQTKIVPITGGECHVFHDQVNVIL